MIFNRQIEVVDDLTYAIVTGVSMEIDKGEVVHTKKDVWIDVDDGTVFKIDVLGPADSTSDCLTICRHECNLYERQPCIDSCHSGMTAMCTSNGSRYCLDDCTETTFSECEPLCEQQAGSDCEISCSAGNPPPAIKQNCIDECTYREEWRCNSECMAERQEQCESDCLTLFLIDCTAESNPACTPKCESGEQYNTCLTDCDEECIPKEWEVSDCTGFPTALEGIDTTYDEYCPLNILSNLIDLSLPVSSNCYWGRGGSEDIGKIYCNAFGTEQFVDGKKNHTYNLIYSCNETDSYQVPCSQFYGPTVVCDVGGGEYMVNVSDFAYSLVSAECYHTPLYT
jgi:hypothetical protein